MTLHIGFLVFPGVQQLDLTGPHDVFASVSGTQVYLINKTLEPVKSSSGLWLTPSITFADCPQLDVICVPGGIGVGELMEDEPALDFIKRQAANARFVTSVCTGALVLGAAGLLRGRRATTHWALHHLLDQFGAIPVKARVVQDGNLMTGGGVTAGIDFALTLLTDLIGETEAQAIQLQLEYAPAPPFDSGTPDTAPKAVFDLVWNRGEAGRAIRTEIVKRAAARLNP
ncbi:MAG: DJ-1/PfpI family protein [Pseudomonadota bacterium]|uniref:ThiJ/PfpI family protein n=1 Tax=Caballeronia sordidicola TaxID=196367 RepID=A0A242N8L2_CABSO|nr:MULTISPECIES: DJ-1/PfpI family protein [Burkholderiaceae]AMM17480.1 dimethylglycine dehydrogenase [Burkholderia sp. PAMC 28687]MDP9153524.1 DJ-1/PfpI family protein [Pseudomonadota bacterium]OTP79958.1 ThiJ/PfpI family protein [Caballeronia sordidicola]